MPIPRPVYASYLDSPPASATGLATFTAEANLWAPALWTPIPAQDMVPGKAYTLRCGGIMQSASAVSWTITPRFGVSATPASNLSLGASSAAPTTATVPASSPWYAEFTLVVRSLNIAASLATITGNGFAVLAASAILPGIVLPMGGTVVTTADWTTAQGLILSATCSASAGTNSIQAQWMSLSS